MSRWLDALLVSGAVAASLAYALAVLGPRVLRARIWRFLARLLARLPAALRTPRLERRVAARAERSEAACGGCGSCGSGATAGAAAEAPRGEVRVPIDRIGRRA